MKNTFVFFLLNPFLGFIQAFKHYKDNWAKNSVWVFVIFYGFTMNRPEEMDSSRYVLRLKELYEASVNWDSFLANFYSDDELKSVECTSPSKESNETSVLSCSTFAASSMYCATFRAFEFISCQTFSDNSGSCFNFDDCAA